MEYIYILKLNTRQLYTGRTSDLKRRIGEHKSGKVRSTNKKDPVLVHYEAYLLGSDADRREKYLKTTEGKRFLRNQLRDLLIAEGILV
jgi:putative endonuclease